MEKILVVSSDQKTSEVLVNILRDSFRILPKVVESAYQAKMRLESNFDYELVIINTPLMDEVGINFAQNIIEKTTANCILLVKQEIFEKISEPAEKLGIILIGKPFDKTLLYQVIKTVNIAVNRSLKLYREKMRLEERIGEIKVIDKAKFMLMEYKNMTENEAHYYLGQYAMTKRKKKSVVASEIIDKLSEYYL